MIAPPVPKFLFADLVGPNGFFHALRHRYPPAGRSTKHEHDFTEVMWINEGEGTHFINDTRQSMQRGYLRVVRPADCHDVVSSTARPIRLSNVAFPVRLLEWLLTEFPPESGYRWCRWLNGTGFPLDGECLTELALLFNRLAASPQSRLAIDRFLIEMIELLEAAADAVHSRDGAPAWFGRAVNEVALHPPLLREGISALSRSAARSTDHVNRICRRHLGRTATEVVNELRLEYAARLLRSSDLDVVEIALASGFQNLSHFYHLFKAHYQISPNHYRNRELSIIRADNGRGTR